MDGIAPQGEFFSPFDGCAAPVGGASQLDELPISFQYFVSHWHDQRPDDGIPPLTAMDQRSAPPMETSGIVFVSEPNGPERLDFRIFRASDAFDFYYYRSVVGCRLDDLYDAEAAELRRQRLGRILRGTRPDYSKRRRSSVPGRGIVWVERVYAPFAGVAGEPTYVGGLCRLSYA
jgi:hypothetical protein